MKLFIDDYSLDGEVKTIYVTITSMNGLVPQEITFEFKITFTAVYCTSDLNVSDLDSEYIFRVGEYLDMSYLLNV